jgi:hypothetical protein
MLSPRSGVSMFGSEAHAYPACRESMPPDAGPRWSGYMMLPDQDGPAM